MKLLIGVPSLDFMHVEFVRSLTNLCLYMKDENVDFDVRIESGTLVYRARDLIARIAVNEGYTHVLWIDSDMVFSKELFEDLSFWGKDFVCGVFHSRRPAYSSCIFKSIELDTLERFETYPDSLFKIDGCGFAGVLISTEILKAVFKKHDTCFTPTEKYGEDLMFCKRAKDLGYEMWCDPSVVMGHIAHIPIYPDYHEKFKNEVLT